MRTRLIKNQRGAALIEAAVTIPIILLISVGIFEFGRAYQTWQVLTNAAREGARVAIIAGSTDDQVTAAVRNYMAMGGLPNAGTAPLVINRAVPFGENTASQVTINYPFSFMMLNPIVQLVTPGAATGAPLTMAAVSTMRNEN